MPTAYKRGDLLLAKLAFSTQVGLKNRPVLVVRDAGDNDLMVLPVTSQAQRVGYDVSLSDWQAAGLKFPSVVRTEKFATVDKSAILRRLGTISAIDWQAVRTVIQTVFSEILHA